jgi:hypothetical protein
MNNLHSLCYLCGLSGPDSRDHVPARAIFYPRLPDDLMTAPAHRSCQGSYARDEAYFAKVLDEARLGGGVGWMRRWGRRAACARKAVAEVGDVERLEAVIKKIVRGLHFRHTGSLLSSQAQIIVQPGLWEGRMMTASGKTSKRKLPAFQSRGSHEEFKYTFINHRKGSTTWILVFHDRFMFQCEMEPGFSVKAPE